MFTDNDYKNYFSELENIFKKILTINTDLVNELSDQSIRSKLHPFLLDDIEAFKFIKRQKEELAS